MKKIIIILIPVIITAANFSLSFALQDDLIISEIMPNPAGTDSDYEWIELHNYSSQERNLKDWSINNTVLPDIQMQPNELLILARNPQRFRERYPVHVRVFLFPMNLNNSSGILNLKHNTSTNQSDFNYSASSEEKSIEVRAGECNLILEHPSSHTAGQSNTPCLLPSPSLTPTPVVVGEYSNKIVISTISPNPSSEAEWIELTNLESFKISLKDWYITDKSGKHVISEQFILPQATLRVIPNTLALNNDGDTLTLFTPDHKQVDIFHYTSSKKDMTLGIASNTSQDSQLEEPEPDVSQCIITEVTKELNYQILNMPQLYRF